MGIYLDKETFLAVGNLNPKLFRQLKKVVSVRTKRIHLHYEPKDHSSGTLLDLFSNGLKQLTRFGFERKVWQFRLINSDVDCAKIFEDLSQLDNFSISNLSKLAQSMRTFNVSIKGIKPSPSGVSGMLMSDQFNNKWLIFHCQKKRINLSPLKFIERKVYSKETKLNEISATLRELKTNGYELENEKQLAETLKLPLSSFESTPKTWKPKTNSVVEIKQEFSTMYARYLNKPGIVLEDKAERGFLKVWFKGMPAGSSVDVLKESLKPSKQSVELPALPKDHEKVVLLLKQYFVPVHKVFGNVKKARVALLGTLSKKQKMKLPSRGQQVAIREAEKMFLKLDDVFSALNKTHNAIESFLKDKGSSINKKLVIEKADLFNKQASNWFTLNKELSSHLKSF